MRPDRFWRSTFGPLLAALVVAVLPGAALGQDCTPPNKAAKASLELRLGDLQLVHGHDTAGIRGIVNEVQGYVAGPWHLPIGLTVAGFDTRFETTFSYREAQPFGYCVALAEAKVSLGYEDITVYVSSEYPQGSCEYDTILAHEQEHVQINRNILRTYKPKFQQAFARVLASKKVIFAQRKDEARSAYLLELQHQFKPVVTEMLTTRNLENGAIDTQDNYRRLLTQCDGWRIGGVPTPGEETHAEATSAAGSAEAARAAAPTTSPPAPDSNGGGSKAEPGSQAIVLAQSEASDPAANGDPDPADFVEQGAALSKANARQLESALKSLPYDFPTRARLLGYYFHNGLTAFGRAATIAARRRHILWLIEIHPDSPVAALPEAMIDPQDHELADPEGYQQAKALWLAQTEARKDDAAVRQNARTFLMRHDAETAEDLL